MKSAHLLRYEPYLLYEFGISIELKKYEIIKETPKGYWIRTGLYTTKFQLIDGEYVPAEDKKWVSNNGKKRFAYPTEKEAFANLVARTKRRKEILESQVDTCVDILKECDKMSKELYA